MNDSLFSAQQQIVEAQARAYNGTASFGEDAFKNDDKPRRRNIEESLFNEGDVIVLPKLPSASPEDAKKWISAPLSKGGDPITRCLVYVTDKNGNESVKQLFAGTLTKSVRNRDTGVTVHANGTAVDAIADCITNQDIWKTLAGKTLVISKATTVPTIRRGFNGQPDRPADGTVLTIDLK